MIESHIETILIVTGILTLPAGIGFIVPRGLLGAVFGAQLSDQATIVIGRHWSLLIALVGGLLLYAAYHAEARVPILVVAAAEKLALGALVLTSPLRKRSLTLVVIGADAVMALLFVLVLSQHGL